MEMTQTQPVASARGRAITHHHAPPPPQPPATMTSGNEQPPTHTPIIIIIIKNDNLADLKLVADHVIHHRVLARPKLVAELVDKAAKRLEERVAGGAVVVNVHPRGREELLRAGRRCDWKRCILRKRRGDSKAKAADTVGGGGGNAAQTNPSPATSNISHRCHQQHRHATDKKKTKRSQQKVRGRACM